MYTTSIIGPCVRTYIQAHLGREIYYRELAYRRLWVKSQAGALLPNLNLIPRPTWVEGEDHFPQVPHMILSYEHV